MALIDFGMKARRELAFAQESNAVLSREFELCKKWLSEANAENDRLVPKLVSRTDALEEIASSTAKAGSAVRLANIARKALGRPVKGGGDE